MRRVRNCGWQRTLSASPNAIGCTVLTHDMRPAVAIALVSGCLGCSCVDDRLPPGSTTTVEAPVSPIALGPPCTPGLALGQGYARIAEIGTLGGNQVFVQDINDDGVAVGAETTADGRFHAFRFTD